MLAIGIAAQPFVTTGSCDPQLPALATAAAHARTAGISLFAPAGDDGYCDRLAWPACLSAVNSIGAVYGEAFGWVERCVAADSCALTEDDQACRSGTLARAHAMDGEVAVDSNSHQVLSLLATASAPALDTAGTLAASTLVAEAARTLQEAAQHGYGVWLTAPELERLLIHSGDPVIDPKSDVVTPRLHLQRAVTNLPALLAERIENDLDRSGPTSAAQPPQGISREGTANPVSDEEEQSPLSALRNTAPTTRAAGQCPYAEHLALDGQTVSDMQTFSACQTLSAGPSFTVTATGDVVLEAEQQITLQPGFKVERGGRLSTHLRPAPVAETVQIDLPSEQFADLVLTSLEESDIPASNDTVVVPQTSSSIVILSDSSDNIAGIGFSSVDQNQRSTTAVSIDATSTAVGLVLLSPLGWIDTGELTTEERIALIQNSAAFARLVELVRAQQQSDATGLADNAEILEAVWDVVADLQPTLASAQASRTTAATAPYVEGASTVRNPNYVPYGLTAMRPSGGIDSHPFTLDGRELGWTFDLPPIQPKDPPAATFQGLTDGKLCAVRYKPFSNYFDTWMMTSNLLAGGVLVASYEALSGNLANLEPDQHLYRLAELNGMMSWNAALVLNVIKSIPGVALIGDAGDLLVSQIREGGDIISFAADVESLEHQVTIGLALKYIYETRQQANSIIRKAAHTLLKNGTKTKLIGKAAKWAGSILVLPQWGADAYFIVDTFTAEHDACFLVENGVVSDFDPHAGYNWFTGSWSACSGPCGLDQGLQTRAVYCRDGSGNQVDDVYCGGAKPAVAQACTASDCDDGDLIAGRYLPIGEDRGIIRDTVNGLEWQRCAVAQTWNPEDETCSGSASRHTWSQATALTAPGGFRLPTISELRTLVYCSSGQPALFGMPSNNQTCGGDYDSPTIVWEAFPNTVTYLFWSSSPGAYSSNYAWNVNFNHGFVNHLGYKSHPLYVRLVRAGQ